MKNEFLLSEDSIYLNHGSYGATPKTLLEHQREWQDRLESHPVHFMSQTYPNAYVKSLESIAPFFGTSSKNIVFVQNATMGVTSILNSLVLDKEDEIICTSHRYQAVFNSLRHRCEKSGSTLKEIVLQEISPNEESVISKIKERISDKTKLIMIDWLSSITAHEFPVHKIIELAKLHDIPIFVDAAHVPGQRPVDLDSLGADFWTGNLHKWLCAPKGCALLYVSPKWQKSIHAPIISHGFGADWQQEFAWMGTFDPSAWLSAPFCIQLWNKMGGWNLVQRNIEIQRKATEHICERISGATPSETDHLCMRAILLPIPGDKSVELYEWLNKKHNIDAFLHPWGEQTMLRISVFSAYNRLNEYKILANALHEYIGS